MHCDKIGFKNGKQLLKDIYICQKLFIKEKSDETINFKWCLRAATQHRTARFLSRP